MKIYIGFEPREISAFIVTLSSLRRQFPAAEIYSLLLDKLRHDQLYRRSTVVKDGRLFDNISEHPMSTEFAISRFLVPYLAQTGWALFTDCDVLARNGAAGLEEYADPKYAVLCVKHNYQPTDTAKMDGQVQSRYHRKNWSSVCYWNCDHPANKRLLTLEYINSVPGRDLHAFNWLKDEEIGELPSEYNYLVGTSKCADPKIVHFTEGTPHMVGYYDCEYADEWRAELAANHQDLLALLGALPA